MSVPNERTRSTGPPTTAGRVTADGKRIFRMTPPLVIWWAWVALLVFSVGDLGIQGHKLVSPKFVFGGLAVTGLVYACTMWSKVVADEAGIKVLNPFRSFSIPWGAVRGIYLADSVEVQCARPAPKKDKTVYCWALSSPRRARARAQLRARQWDQGKRSRPAGYSQMPEPAQRLVRMTTAEIMARELAAMADEARFRSVVSDIDIGASGSYADGDRGRQEADRPQSEPEGESQPGGKSEPEGTSAAYYVSSTWAWPPLIAILVPAVGFVVTLLVN